jgi:MGT family glycosyltransferase
MADGRHVLIVTIPEKGHINPVIGVAQHLVAAGHRVEFFSQADFSDQLRRAHLPCPCHTPGSKPSREVPATKGREFAEKLRDAPWLRRWIEHLLLDVVPAQMGPLRELVQTSSPDVVVTDPMVYSAVLVSETERIPWVGVSSSLNPVTPDEWECELTATVCALSEKRRALFAGYGVDCPFKVCDAMSPWLNVVFTTEEYAPRAWSGNDRSFYVGPSRSLGARGDEQDFPWDRLESGKPIAYMSLGSQIYHHPELFSAVAHALSPSEAQLVFAMNELASTDFARSLPGHVLPVHYSPQAQLLERVDLMITHGGANSVMEALDHGCALAQLPICNDQFLQAEFIRRSGAGVVLDAKRPSAETYRKALLPLLDPPGPARTAAKRIARSYAAHDGAKETAQLIEQLAATRSPVMPSLETTS